MGIPGRNRIVAFACVVCSIGRDAAELLVWWDLVEQVRQHRSVPDAAARDLDCLYLQRFLIDPNMYLAPQPPFRPTVLAGIPLAFTLSFDPCAVRCPAVVCLQTMRGDQQMQWSCRTFVLDSDGQRFLTVAKGAKIRCCPVQPDKLEKACHKSSRLPQRQTEQYLEGQAGLYCRIAVGLMTPPSP